MSFRFNPVSGQFEMAPMQGGGGNATPTKIASGGIFTVEADTQMLFSEMIDVQGELVLDGILVEVN
jgi:hypothetical protein